MAAMALGRQVLLATLVTTVAGLSTHPPRGWNSWNSYQQWVNETQLLAQANFIVSSGMRELGWEYVVSDGGWYYPNEAGPSINGSLIDQWGRLVPTPDRYPTGWKAVCDRIHNLGLKCGFHLFRGVAGRAWELDSPIKGSKEGYTARDAGYNGRPGEAVVKGHGAFYELNMHHPAATQYLDSMFELYCSWGIDFIKLDGTSSGRMNQTSYHAIKAYRGAIQKHCGGRNVVLSLSAGGAGIPGWPNPNNGNVNDEYVETVRPWVEMIRVTPDTWDIWDDEDTSCPLSSEWAHMRAVTTSGPYANVTGHSGCCWGGRIAKHFEEFAHYAHMADQFGVWPDGDMLQMGRVGAYPNLTSAALSIYGADEPTYAPVKCTPAQLKGVQAQQGAAGGGYDPQNCPRLSYLDLEEQKTLFTLWSVARSPLVMGGDLVQSPKEVITLLTNQDILEMNWFAINASELSRSKHETVWSSVASGEGRLGHGTYVAVFNLGSQPRTIHVAFDQIFKDRPMPPKLCHAQELWTQTKMRTSEIVADLVPRHGTQVFFLAGCVN